MDTQTKAIIETNSIINQLAALLSRELTESEKLIIEYSVLETLKSVLIDSVNNG